MQCVISCNGKISNKSNLLLHLYFFKEKHKTESFVLLYVCDLYSITLSILNHSFAIITKGWREIWNMGRISALNGMVG